MMRPRQLMTPSLDLGHTRKLSMETYMVRVYTGRLGPDLEFTSVECVKDTTAAEVVMIVAEKLKLKSHERFELAEGFCSQGQLCKERRLDPTENPVRIQLMWKRASSSPTDKFGANPLTEYRFFIRNKEIETAATMGNKRSWIELSTPSPIDNFLSGYLQPKNKEYTDLCNLPDLNERTLLEHLKNRFTNKNIYTYVGSILISVNPFKFYPIYNPKDIKMYQNHRLGDLPPHIFAIADAAFYKMLEDKQNQCIVISGESGSGKTEATNLLLHHLTALSQNHGTGVEQTILGAGPVLEVGHSMYFLQTCTYYLHSCHAGGVLDMGEGGGWLPHGCFHE